MQVQANWENQLLALAGQIPHPHTRPFFSYWAGDASLQKAYKQAEKDHFRAQQILYLCLGSAPGGRTIGGARPVRLLPYRGRYCG